MNTELYFDDQLAQFDKQEIIAGTYALNKLGDIASRQGTKSNTYTLPFVKQNKLIFDNAELVDNESEKPYRLFSHRVVIEGVEVFNGTAYISESKDGYKIQAVAGNSDFYAIIKNVSSTLLDYSDVDHIRNEANIIASWPNTSGYIYPFIDYGKYQNVESSSVGSDDSGNVVSPDDMYPALFFKTMITKIADYAGYVLHGDVMSNVRFNEEIIPFTQTTFKPVDTSGAFTGSTLGLVTAHQPRSIFSITIKNDPDGLYDAFGFYNSTYSKYIGITVNATAGINVSLRLWKRPSTVTSNSATQDPADVQIAGVKSTTGTATMTVTRNKYILNKGDRLFFTVDGGTTTQQVYISKFEIEVQSVDNGYGLLWSFAKNIKDTKIDKIFLDFLNRYGLIMQTDNENKVVTLTYFDQVLLNDPVDWSGKIDYTDKPDIFYRFDDYNQVNALKYAVSDDFTNASEYDFVIDDETLAPDTKTTYESAFILPLHGAAFMGSVDTINVGKFVINPGFNFRGNWESGVTYNKGDVVFFLNLTDGSTALYQSFTTNTSFPPTNLTPDWNYANQADIWTIGNADLCISRILRQQTGPTVNFYTSPQEVKVMATSSGMTFTEIWNAHYNLLDRILHRTKIWERPLKLSYTDINQLDITRPVYLEELGNYFYVDEVRQFKYNQVDSTIVRLIRI